MAAKMGGAGRAASPKNKTKKKSGTGGKLILAAVTFLNLLLSLLLTLLRRQEVLHAVNTDEGVKLLLTERKRTKE